MKIQKSPTSPVTLLGWTVLVLVLFSICEAKNHKVQLDNAITLKARMPDLKSIEFTIEAPKGTWVALGFGETLKGSDFFLVKEEEGQGTIIDGHSFSTLHLLKDETNDYELQSSIEEEHNVFIITRNIDTGDVDDYLIGQGDHIISYAYGTDLENPRFRRGNDGQLTLLIDPEARDIGLRSPDMDPLLPRRKLMNGSGLVHVLATYIVWGVLSFGLVVTGRYTKYFFKTRMWIHTAFGILALILNIIGVSKTPGGGKSANGLGSSHESLAGPITMLTAIECGTGVVVKLFQVFLQHWTFLTQWSRYFHQFAGYLLIAYGHLGFLSGLYLYDSSVTFLFYIHTAVTILAYVVIEIIFVKKSQWKYPDLSDLEERTDIPEISLSEFEDLIKQGKKYCLMDRYVLDVTWYRFEHPGSKYVFDRCIGRDVGKYFYGSYSMEDWVKPWTHSYISGLIVKQLVCAKITEPRDNGILAPSGGNFNPRENSGGMNSIEQIEAQVAKNSKANIFYVQGKTEIMRDVYLFKMYNKSVKVRSYYLNLDQAGRGYIINSPTEEISRYYTICNCMNERYYEGYIDAFDSEIESKQRSKNFSETTDEDFYDPYIEFVIKVYHQTKKGLAKQLLNAPPDKPFIVEGPFGRGLEFPLQGGKGNFLIFVGGTGILPYMDIFAYMVRWLIAEKSQNGPIFPNEKFDENVSNVNIIIYAYYTNKENACGYQFMEKASRVFDQHCCGKQLQFYPKFTRDGDRRLNKEDLKEVLAKHAQNDKIDRLWVCGPPTMNNMFHKYMSMVKKTLNITQEDIDIL